MKKLLTAIATAVFVVFASLCFASYVIHLKSGQVFQTDRYWEEGKEIKFYRYGGVVGFRKDLVKEIEEVENLPHEKEAAAKQEAPAAPEKAEEIEEAKEQGESEAEKGVQTSKGEGEGSGTVEAQPESGKDIRPPQPNAENKKLIEKFMKEFNLLEQRFKDVQNITDEELYEFAKDLTVFKKRVLTSQLGGIFAKQLLETYSMGDEVEAILKLRGH